jgi:hypothetical protein
MTGKSTLMPKRRESDWSMEQRHATMEWLIEPKNTIYPWFGWEGRLGTHSRQKVLGEKILPRRKDNWMEIKRDHGAKVDGKW